MTAFLLPETLPKPDDEAPGRRAAYQKIVNIGIQGFLAKSHDRICGLCRQKNHQARNDQTVCWRCTDAIIQLRNAGYQLERRRTNFCRDCGQEIRPHASFCTDCLKKHRKQAWRAEKRRQRRPSATP